MRTRRPRYPLRKALPSLTVLLLFVTACSIASGSPATQPRQGVTAMISYDVAPERSDYIQREEIRAVVRIVNDSDEPVVVPDPGSATNRQPMYHLVGPGIPDGRTFSNLSLHRTASREKLPTSERPADLVTIEPGDEAAALLPLGSVLDSGLTGEYRLSSNLDWQDMKTESRDSTFRIDPLNIHSIHLGLGVRASGHGEGGGAFIHRGARTSQLFGFSIHENRPGIGEAKLGPPIHRLEVGPDATDVTVPWRNTSFSDELVKWLVWREGATIKALADTGTNPIAVDLPAEPARLVRPALKAAGGPVEVLAVTREGSELTMVRFQTVPIDKQKGAIVWTEPLPAAPDGITVALAPESLKSRRVVAFTVQRDNGFELFLSSYPLSGPLEPFRSVRIGEGRLVPGVAPAVVADSEGNAVVAALALTDPENRTCALVEATFPAQGEAPAKPRIQILGDLPAEAVGGAVFYEAPEGSLDRRVVVVELEGGHLLKMGEQGHLAPVPDRGQPTTPVLVVPGQRVSYVLYFEPERGLHLESI